MNPATGRSWADGTLNVEPGPKALCVVVGAVIEVGKVAEVGDGCAIFSKKLGMCLAEAWARHCLQGGSLKFLAWQAVEDLDGLQVFAREKGVANGCCGIVVEVEIS